MDRAKILAQFDREMRMDPPLEDGYTLEREGPVLRAVGERAWITYSSLSEAEAPGAVRREAALFRDRGISVEWKLYSHDRPPTLPALLEANGFVRDPPETLMVLDLDGPLQRGTLAPGVTVRRVEDRATLEEAVRVSRTAFAPGPGWTLEEYLPKLASPEFAAFVAWFHGTPVSAGRLDLPARRAFASLWGGGTVPEHRGKGIYRALVAARADAARTRGYRYLTVDAMETSRPILERVGFQPLAPVVGWVLTP
jgi:GNAT superfamily N-acetyltransferase